MLRVAKETIFTIDNGWWLEISPINYLEKFPDYFAPTWRFLKNTIKWIGGEIIDLDYYYCYSKISFIRRIFPKKLCTCFIVKMRKEKNEKRRSLPNKK
jgi:hypothetical protein